MKYFKLFTIYFMSIAYTYVGFRHFIDPDFFLAIMPNYLSMHLFFVYLSGIMEFVFGILLAFIQYARQFFQPIRGLSEKFNTLQSALASSERIFEVLDTEHQINTPDSPKTLNNPKGYITFNNVWFRYNEEGSWILQDVSFQVQPGQHLAIVGATGAGKTTIINLLLRFYEIQKGTICIDGVDITELDLSELRTLFGLVLQDHSIFTGTVYENIALGNSDISLARVKKAAEAVEASRFIEKLPGGYQHLLQKQGSALSMGQKQLICFVRALVYNPLIMVLDEATSSVDSETEALVNIASKKAMHGRTTIAVAHRLSTIQDADTILVMHKGEIREVGTHQELLTQDHGIYRKLYELQYKDQSVQV